MWGLWNIFVIIFVYKSSCPVTFINDWQTGIPFMTQWLQSVNLLMNYLFSTDKPKCNCHSLTDVQSPRDKSSFSFLKGATMHSAVNRKVFNVRLSSSDWAHRWPDLSPSHFFSSTNLLFFSKSLLGFLFFLLFLHFFVFYIYVFFFSCFFPYNLEFCIYHTHSIGWIDRCYHSLTILFL